MVALVKPSLRVLPMAPKPSAIWFINLVVSWFCVGVSPCWTTNTRKTSIRTKKNLDNFSTLGTSSSYFSRDSSTTVHFRVFLPPFSFLGAPKGVIKKFTSPLNSKEWKLMSNSTISLGIFSYPSCFWRATGIFNGEPTFTLSTPFLCLTGEEVLSWAFI